MSRPTVLLSPTDCELCAAAERPPQRPVAALGGLLLTGLVSLTRPRRPSSAAIVAGYGAAMAGMLRAAGPPALTPYERHRARWIQTGDVLELERMLRHPLPAQPEHRRPPQRPGRRDDWGQIIWALGACAAALAAGFALGMLLIGGTG